MFFFFCFDPGKAPNNSQLLLTNPLIWNTCWLLTVILFLHTLTIAESFESIKVLVGLGNLQTGQDMTKVHNWNK